MRFQIVPHTLNESHFDDVISMSHTLFDHFSQVQPKMLGWQGIDSISSFVAQENQL